MTNPKKTIEVVLDKRARWDERDDAAMYLAEFDDLDSYNALISVARDLSEDEVLQSTCGESIGIRWKRDNFFDRDIFDILSPSARDEIVGVLGLDFKKDSM